MYMCKVHETQLISMTTDQDETEKRLKIKNLTGKTKALKRDYSNYCRDVGIERSVHVPR